VTTLRVFALAAALPALLACGRIDTEVGAQAEPSVDATAPGPTLDAAPPDDAGARDAAPEASTSVYFEAEDGVLSGGFIVESDPDASAGRYIAPPADPSLAAPGPASAEYSFAVSETASYVLWGRLRAPAVDSNTLWVSIDDAPATQWRLSTGLIWFWGAVTTGTRYGVPNVYALAAGAHRLVIRNSAAGVGLDRLYVTAGGDEPPGNDTRCDPPNSIQLADGGCEPSCGSHGITVCGPVACAGQPQLVAYDCDVCCLEPRDH